MRKILTIVFAAALLSSCSVREKLYVQLPGTVWSLTREGVTTWVCFHDSDSASLLQYSSKLDRIQIDHGTYLADGHVITVSTEYASPFMISRTFFALKRSSGNEDYTKLFPYIYPTLNGTIWAAPVNNDLHLAYFLSDNECLDIVYTNISRDEEGRAYSWSSSKNTVSFTGSEIKSGGAVATTYKGIMTVGCLAARLINDPLEEEGTSNLKGTIWTYNNTGYPADVPSVIIFNGKDTFTRITGVWTGNTSSVRVNPIIFDIASGTYSESGGTLTLTTGDKNESCPLSGSSFTLFEKTFSKLDY